MAGLHRTGTSVLSRILGAHPSISSIEGAPVPENEGCYLQGAIPHTALHGRPGHYATDPAQHHTESSRFNSLETQQRLVSDWSRWYDDTKPWWLEKSPVNLTRTRLYQQLFPTAQFMVILRHPQVMAAALAKWVDADPAALVRHALDAYDTVREDLRYLHAAYVVRYEDLIARADDVRRSLFAFLSLDDHAPGIALRNGNSEYEVSDVLDAELAARMNEWGYQTGGITVPVGSICRHPLRAVQEVALAHIGTENREISGLSTEKEQKANIRQ
ncbi:sulfotransferase family protein [Qipengyuania aquimaris]|uniref:sulfotransferase family protein n=1 Tax=Qipengyuania aquimaris TaxID=255984 RepID=UPI002D7F106E|nr:sulfotransferase [Qipengyuania aquimaris]